MRHYRTPLFDTPRAALRYAVLFMVLFLVPTALAALRRGQSTAQLIVTVAVATGFAVISGAYLYSWWHHPARATRGHEGDADGGCGAGPTDRHDTVE
ncbi:MAG: hypothetical protein ACRDRL_00010 [Sciscionella sp.]